MQKNPCSVNVQTPKRGRGSVSSGAKRSRPRLPLCELEELSDESILDTLLHSIEEHLKRRETIFDIAWPESAHRARADAQDMRTLHKLALMVQRSSPSMTLHYRKGSHGRISIIRCRVAGSSSSLGV